jgi:MscS family membrane protein
VRIVISILVVFIVLVAKQANAVQETDGQGLPAASVEQGANEQLHRPEQQIDADQETVPSKSIAPGNPQTTVEEAAAAYVYEAGVKAGQNQPQQTLGSEHKAGVNEEDNKATDVVPVADTKNTKTRVKLKPKLPDRPVKRKVDKSDEQLILGHIEQLIQLNKKMSEIEGEEDLNQLLVKENKVLASLMQLLRATSIEQLPHVVHGKQLDFLNSRIAINKERGNEIAVQRDQVKLAYYRANQSLREYVNYLIQASKDYIPIDVIILESERALQQSKNQAKEITLPKVLTGSSVYKELEKNYMDFMNVNNAYQDVIDYVISNPREIAKSHWFQQFTLLSAISYFNSFDIIKAMNHKLAPFRLDVGGAIVSLMIFALVFFSYPFVFRCSGWFFENYVLEKGEEEQEQIYHELRRPIRFLMVFFGVDLATYALFYKAKYKESIEQFTYVIYAFIFVWFLFKVLDTLVVAHFQKMSETNKGLRKELINLAIQFSKGGVIIIAMVFVFNHFGISVTAIVSTLGIGGLAFALAAKDTLSNLFGGITILFDNVFKMGDWVKINDVEGTVAEIGLRSTTIRTFDNSLITVPNSTISVTGVKNWNRRAIGRRIKMLIGVTYESDMDDIRQALVDIRTMLNEHPGIANPKEKHDKRGKRFRFSSHEDAQGIKSTQLVFLDRYSDFSIDILIYCFSKTVVWSEWLAVKEDVLFKIDGILKKNNLQFAYPTAVRILRTEENQQSNDEVIVDLSG